MTATARMNGDAVIDMDPDTLGAARLVIDGLRSELAALQQELREHQQLIAGFQEVGEHPKIEVDWEKREYMVVRHFVREYGPFKDFHEAVRVRAEILARTQVQPLADAPVTKGEKHHV